MNDINIPSSFINVGNVNKNTSERLGGTWNAPGREAGGGKSAATKAPKKPKQCER